MPRTRECDFCGGDIEPGTGTMFVRTNGSTVHFCSAKCEKNADLGRKARDLEWTESGQGEATKAGTSDAEGDPEDVEEPEKAEPPADDGAATPAEQEAEEESEEPTETDKAEEKETEAEAEEDVEEADV